MLFAKILNLNFLLYFIFEKYSFSSKLVPFKEKYINFPKLSLIAIENRSYK